MSAATTRNTLGWSLGIAAVVVAVATIAAAITVMGTPAEQRAARIDDRRIDDLEALDLAIRLSADKRGVLPVDLATLAREPGRKLSLQDPDSGALYPYVVTAKNAYRLCAVFTTDTAEDRSAPARGDWAHGRGRTCFDRSWKRGKTTTLSRMAAEAEMSSGP